MSTAALNLSGAQAGDVRAEAVAGGDVNYLGVPPEDLLGLLADAVQDERQYRRLADAETARRFEQFDRRLDRITLILQRVVLALALEASVLALVLVAALVLIGALVVGPRLADLEILKAAGIFS